MGWFGPQSGDCGCCGFACDSCSGLTFFTISGISDFSGCPGGCDRINGTYVFRTSFTKVRDCGWSKTVGSYNCPLFGDSDWLLGSGVTGSCDSVANTYDIDFEDDPGGVLVKVTIVQKYTLQFSGTSVGYYTHIFSDVFASCADAIGATLPLTSTSNVTCDGTDPGDKCGVAGATVTLG